MEQIRTAKEIKKSWSEYDKTVAKCHMVNYGKIYLDNYGCPIDNDIEIEEIRHKEVHDHQ